MSSQLVALYQAECAAGHDHAAALDHLCARLHLARATVKRALRLALNPEPEHGPPAPGAAPSTVSQHKHLTPPTLGEKIAATVRESSL